MGWCYAGEFKPPLPSDGVDRVGKAYWGRDLQWKAHRVVWGLRWEAEGNLTAGAKALGSFRPVLSHEASSAEAREGGEYYGVGGGPKNGQVRHGLKRQSNDLRFI